MGLSVEPIRLEGPRTPTASAFTGSGADIWGGSDQFHGVWQTLTGDGNISAHVTSQTNSDPWAKAGVMLRQSTDAGSPYYAIVATPGNGIDVQYRATWGGSVTTMTYRNGDQTERTGAGGTSYQYDLTGPSALTASSGTTCFTRITDGDLSAPQTAYDTDAQPVRPLGATRCMNRSARERRLASRP